ncbi:unnamed protein product [Soboliphyme baturini]|uniref:Uncharacterized protein n=1 Tax=Soboliphyme baturini TaxID=241478 RepID=A0A183I9D7_9BILA|nr:unnamed protein product [Soboliphyme baturini]
MHFLMQRFQLAAFSYMYREEADGVLECMETAVVAEARRYGGMKTEERITSTRGRLKRPLSAAGHVVEDNQPTAPFTSGN